MASDNRAAAANDLDVIQDMIAISADRLEGLRTQCATSATLTQQEIRCLETKLLRMFSELLLTKERLNERIPASGLPPHHTIGNELKQWLRVVGLSADSLASCLATMTTMEQLLKQNDDELRQLLIKNNPNYREEEVRRLIKAMQNLKKCKQLLKDGEGGSCSGGGGSGSGDVGNGDSPTVYESREHLLENLFWDSWDRNQHNHQHHHHHHHHHRGSVGNIGIMASPRSTQRIFMKQARHGGGGQQSPLHDNNSSRTTLDDSASLSGSSPPGSMFAMPANNASFINQALVGLASGSGGGGGGSLNGTPLRGKPAGTPPPLKKHQTLLSGNANQSMTPTHAATTAAATTTNSQSGLDKAKTNEQTQFHQHQQDNAHSPSSRAPLSRLPCADPSPDSFSSASSDLGQVDNPNNLQVPRSPCTPIAVSNLGMGHTISHRFTKVFKMMATCELCHKQMFFGLKCKECKYRCHKDCEINVPPSCGLPREFVDEFKKTLQDQVGGFHALGGGASGTNQSSVNTSPNLNALSGGVRHQRAGKRRLHKNSQQVTNNPPDSSSAGSSCNSSGPSSPALLNLLQQQHHNNTSGHGVGAASMSFGGGLQNANIMNSSGGGSSSTSSNMLSTPSSFYKNSSQFQFPDVTVTANCNLESNNSAAAATHTLYSSQSSNNDLESLITSPQFSQEQHNEHIITTTTTTSASTSTTTTATAAQAEAQEQHNHTQQQQQLENSVGNDANSYANLMTSSINSNSNSTNSRIGSVGTHSTIASSSGSSTVMSMSMVSTGTFYPRKLSSAGVDKRDLTDTYKSNDSDKTVSLSGSTDSDRTPVRLDSTEDADSGHWPRQNSLSAKEWDIPYDDLRLLEQIGMGRFGTVHRALWHGPVAVKLLKEDYLRDERMLEAFRLEVANFKKTRHENLVLFMGACMKPPFLAIVTSLCKGNTLYTYIHIRRDKFTINKTTLVAQQISQGMGYLHARGIVHKDLRTKNIFLENGKVIITDFGLFSSTKLNYCDNRGLCVPNGWLCYMSPELMRALMAKKPSEEVLPFTRSSDVYSFGSVWYELLCGEFPFRTQPPESIIWQVGRGMKQTLANLHTSRDVKDILMLCWSFQADDRPDFQRLLNLLEKLPKKRLARSPSHPVQFTSRSAESVF